MSFLQSKCPELAKTIKNRTIIIWKDRINHIRKHCYENPNFSMEEMCEILPEIIKSPDFLGVKDTSVQFIPSIRRLFLPACLITNTSSTRINIISKYSLPFLKTISTTRSI